MLQKWIVPVVAVMAGFAATVPYASATIVAGGGSVPFNNVFDASQGAAATIPLNDGGYQGPLDTSFTANSGSTVTNVQLLLSATDAADDGAGVLVTIWDDFFTSPNNAIGTVGFVSDQVVTANAFTSGPNAGLTLVSFPTNILLEPSANDGSSDTSSGPNEYWIQLDDCSQVSCSDPPPPTTIGWSTDGNNTYPGENNQIGGAVTPNAISQTFQACVAVNGGTCTAPEPGSLSVLGLALAGLGLAIRRRRRRN